MTERVHVLLFRAGEGCDVLGVFRSRERAVWAAVSHAQQLIVEDDLEAGETWEAAVHRWSDLSDGEEEFVFEEHDVQ